MMNFSPTERQHLLFQKPVRSDLSQQWVSSALFSVLYISDLFSLWRILTDWAWAVWLMHKGMTWIRVGRTWCVHKCISERSQHVYLMKSFPLMNTTEDELPPKKLSLWKTPHTLISTFLLDYLIKLLFIVKLLLKHWTFLYIFAIYFVKHVADKLPPPFTYCCHQHTQFMIRSGTALFLNL